MKRFSLFLTEAGTSKAALQAKKLNLKSDQHGMWLDTRGNPVAKTEGGRLVFLDKKKAAAEDPVKQMAKRRADDDLAGAPLQKKPAPQAKAKAKEEPEKDAKSGGDTLTIAFGRFNPPTAGHEKLLQAAEKAAGGGDIKIYPSRTQDKKKNPIDPDMKVSYMRKMFPDFKDQIVNDAEMRSIFDVLIAAEAEGYKNINIIVGADRLGEFESLATKYNGDLYNFGKIQTISAGPREDDAAGIEGISASKLRKAVRDDDFDAFKRGLPKSVDDADANALFNAVRTGMGLKAGDAARAKAEKEKKSKAASASKGKAEAKAKKASEKRRVSQDFGYRRDAKEDFEFADWQIAPRFDQQMLREKYVTKKIFKKGDLVENLNTGLVGKIIRRGTNYLISVTEQNVMFKSWIKDVMEAVVNYSGPSGVPADDRLVGTDSHREYAMRMTGTKAIRNFINKYRKNK